MGCGDLSGIRVYGLGYEFVRVCMALGIVGTREWGLGELFRRFQPRFWGAVGPLGRLQEVLGRWG